MIPLHPQFLLKEGKPQFAILPYEEYLQLAEALARAAENMRVDPRFGGFWDNLPAEELARRQGVQPVADAAALYGGGDPADWEGFDEALEEWRG
ncbi:MAG: hypothetical protein HYV27_21280 [Candidatus Hydrogenedentes bacterium]|nr:hypothetical protein [Candidatus Hydrogenedentota bacterium]